MTGFTSTTSRSRIRPGTWIFGIICVALLAVVVFSGGVPSLDEPDENERLYAVWSQWAAGYPADVSWEFGPHADVEIDVVQRFDGGVEIPHQGFGYIKRGLAKRGETISVIVTVDVAAMGPTKCAILDENDREIPGTFRTLPRQVSCSHVAAW